MNWQRNLWCLWSGCIISSASYTMLIPFLPLYLLDLGVTGTAINLWSAIVFSVTFFISALMSPYWGRKADKSGKRRMLIRAGFSLAAAYFLGSLVRNPIELFMVRILQGFATGFVPAALSIVASTAPKEKIGFSLGIMQTATLVGSIIGPLFGGTLSHLFGIRMSFIVAACIMFIGTLVVSLFVTEPARNEVPQASGVIDDLKTAFNNLILLEMLVLLFIAQIAVMVLQPLITLYVAELQGQLEGTVLISGIIFSLAGIAGAIAAPLWGKGGQKAGFSQVLISGFLGAGLFNSLQFFVGDIWSFALLQFIFGFFIAGIYVAVNAIVVANTNEGFRGRAFGLTMSANQLGSMFGPLIGGVVSGWIGIKFIFIYTGIFLIIVGFVIWRQRGKY
ncbi:MFS transporter [Pelosinus baikalensis]|uniref:MFS transporter n=1 Tax=Pelosinus baikalensis TaxID=2892015 RepID=A0ABS8HZQ3_9FIRM|nr:MFS transporter [Pelosinus baikalensis]MCC5468643.1 MFS transporter [Pelosinus baikalensis]